MVRSLSRPALMKDASNCNSAVQHQADQQPSDRLRSRMKGETGEFRTTPLGSQFLGSKAAIAVWPYQNFQFDVLQTSRHRVQLDVYLTITNKKPLTTITRLRTYCEPLITGLFATSFGSRAASSSHPLSPICECASSPRTFHPSQHHVRRKALRARQLLLAPAGKATKVRCESQLEQLHSRRERHRAEWRPYSIGELTAQ